jgi:hypothetical protein
MKKKSPLKAGLIFGALMLVFTALYQYYEGAALDLKLVFSSLVGGLTGGIVYGGIEWMKQRGK